MSILYDQLAQTLPAEMSVPEPLRLLYGWIEQRGHYNRDDDDGTRFGLLYPLEAARSGAAGTWLEFYAQGFPTGYEFGANTALAADRLRVFARTGGDGSMAALWLDDAGDIRIVHLGSGSGSIMLCVLADDAVDFLRLCAIGYEELCWGEDEFAAPPVLEDAALGAVPNAPFRRWVETTFSTTIPATGAEIVRHPIATMHSDESDDPFWLWCQ